MEATIRTAIEKALAELGVEGVDFVVEYPNDLAHGDFASNAALVAAKPIGKAPRTTAEQLCAALGGKIDGVEKIEVAGPGFLNFYLTRQFFIDSVAQIATQKESWGRHASELGETVLVEYTSPNLFKPLHIGNLVGNIIGESISRLFEFAGADVKRFNYPSDIGLTVAKGVWGLQQTGGDPSDIAALGEAYRVGNAAYEAEGEEKAAIAAINKALYKGTDATLNSLREQGITTSKARLDELLTILGTHFDFEIPESMVSEPGLKIVSEHVGDVFTESEGAIVYDGERSGLHTRVFINSLGLPTYEAKDVGHFVLKTEKVPDWTRSVIVTGNEQAEYFKVLYAALRELFPEIGDRTLEHIPTGFLTLTTGKMSSRKGNVLTGESLLEEMEGAAHERAAESRTDDLGTLTEQVAVAALKYQILRHHVGANIVFDKEQALSFEGDSGPYLQYTYARICSVLEKAKAASVTPTTGAAPTTVYPLERVLYRFPSITASALADRAPHQLVTYLTELAAAFNAFYAAEKIADVSDEYAPYKAAVASAVAQTLKNGLWLLGIQAPAKM